MSRLGSAGGVEGEARGEHDWEGEWEGLLDEGLSFARLGGLDEVGAWRISLVMWVCVVRACPPATCDSTGESLGDTRRSEGVAGVSGDDLKGVSGAGRGPVRAVGSNSVCGV